MSHGIVISLLWTEIGIALAWAAGLAALLWRLRRDHPAAYDALGRPVMWRIGWHPSEGQLYRFLLFRRYRALKDRRLASHADLLLALAGVFLVIFGCFVYLNLRSLAAH